MKTKLNPMVQDLIKKGQLCEQILFVINKYIEFNPPNIEMTLLNRRFGRQAEKFGGIGSVLREMELMGDIRIVCNINAAMVIYPVIKDEMDAVI